MNTRVLYEALVRGDVVLCCNDTMASWVPLTDCCDV
jgi:hypothetical protein